MHLNFLCSNFGTQRKSYSKNTVIANSAQEGPRQTYQGSFFCEITVVLLISTFRGKCCDLIYQLDEWLQGRVFALSEKFCCTLCNDNKVYSILNAQKSFNSSEDPKDPIRWNGSAIKIVEFTVYVFPSESWYIFSGDLWYWYWYHIYYVLFGAHVHSCMLQWAAVSSARCMSFSPGVSSWGTTFILPEAHQTCMVWLYHSFVWQRGLYWGGTLSLSC